MDIYKVCGIVILGVVVSLVLKGCGSNLAGYLTTYISICVMLFSFVAMSPIIVFLKEIGENTRGGLEALTVLLKAVSVLSVSQVVSDICIENGEKMLLDALGFATGVAVLLLALPLLREFFVGVIGLMEV